MASLTSFYTFYLIDTFHLPVQSAQLHLFLFLGAVAAGTVIGGPVGDRIGYRRVIWWSILGVLPFTLVLPYANLFWTAVLSVPIGLILASAFPAILVYAQGLLPGRVGMVAGLFFGLAFGMAGIGAAVLGWLADQTEHRRSSITSARSCRRSGSWPCSFPRWAARRVSAGRGSVRSEARQLARTSGPCAGSVIRSSGGR